MKRFQNFWLGHKSGIANIAYFFKNRVRVLRSGPHTHIQYFFLKAPPPGGEGARNVGEKISSMRVAPGAGQKTPEVFVYRSSNEK